MEHCTTPFLSLRLCGLLFTYSAYFVHLKAVKTTTTTTTNTTATTKTNVSPLPKKSFTNNFRRGIIYYWIILPSSSLLIFFICGEEEEKLLWRYPSYYNRIMENMFFPSFLKAIQRTQDLETVIHQLSSNWIHYLQCLQGLFFHCFKTSSVLQRITFKCHTQNNVS